jgi:hypothetical protein
VFKTLVDDSVVANENLNVAEISDAHVTETGVGRVPALTADIAYRESLRSRPEEPLSSSSFNPLHEKQKKLPTTGKECVELRLRPKFIPAGTDKTATSISTVLTTRRMALVQPVRRSITGRDRSVQRVTALIVQLRRKKRRRKRRALRRLNLIFRR